MKNFTKELKDILKEDPGAPILSPDEVLKRANTMVVLTNQASPKLLALAGSSRRAILLNYDPLMITFPDQRGVYQVGPDDIVFENHHSGRDVTEAGGEETPYEKFFSQAMKKFGVSSPIELSPDDTKKFFNYVDKNWEAEEESDGSKSEGGWEDPPKLGGEPSLITPMEGNDNEDANEAVKVVPYTYWNKASDDKRAKLLQLAKPGISTKFTKVDYDGLTPMLKKAIEKVFKTKKAQIEIAPAAAAAISGVIRAKEMYNAIENEATEEARRRARSRSFGNEDVSTGKVGKKDKGSYQHAYKLALKKYQIHSADELDTPAERKGFTAYVDRLWKGGEVHEDKKKESAVTEAPKSSAQRDRERIKKQKQQQAKQKQKKKQTADAKRKQTATSSQKEDPQEKKPTFAQKVKDKTAAAATAAKSKIAQVKADRDKKAAERDREQEQKSREQEKEREQAAREKEKEQKAKEKDNDDDGDGKDNGDNGDDDKKKDGALRGIGSFLKQAGGAATQAAKSQASQYAVKS